MIKEKRPDKKNMQAKTLSLGLKVFLFSIAILLFACQDVKKPPRPENLISKEKMAAILLDSYISNAARSVNNKLLISLDIKQDSVIYIKFDIDSLQLAESNAFYSSDLKAYGEIIISVEKSLEALHKEKDSIYQIQKRKKGDTINSNNYKIKTLIDPVKSIPVDSLQLKSLK